MPGTFKIVQKQFILTNVGTEEAPVIDLDIRHDLSDGVQIKSIYTKHAAIVEGELTDADYEADEENVLLSANI